jgi:hypothetical protein
MYVSKKYGDITQIIINWLNSTWILFAWSGIYSVVLCIAFWTSLDSQFAGSNLPADGENGDKNTFLLHKL